MNFVPAPGFADPVMDATAMFRAVLAAMAHPGRVVDLPVATQAPLPLGGGLGALLLALADRETPLWLAPDMASADVTAWIGFHAGASVIQDRGQAVFALADKAEALLPLDAFSVGMPEYPDRSATLIVKVASLGEGTGLLLRGPGIAETARLEVGGVPKIFWQARDELSPLYPLGIDLILCAGAKIAALPRTTMVEI
ncbi:Alpha-D-ribose 1-methylphosphonate 5-triphosphate synthase subunit PhnH [Rhodospirillaceae bacterium LM-1]|nr:Alpha-D-ribose 1-methylphosphonate 5-triphosphate synthase subunit PhnH [Rhodospirillaceae bacterium LM-1]